VVHQAPCLLKVRNKNSRAINDTDIKVALNGAQQFGQGSNGGYGGGFQQPQTGFGRGAAAMNGQYAYNGGNQNQFGGYQG